MRVYALFACVYLYGFRLKVVLRRIASAASGSLGPVADDDVDPVERMYSPA
jgi:hypothetical protein